jgi:hypothetical protein
MLCERIGVLILHFLCSISHLNEHLESLLRCFGDATVLHLDESNAIDVHFNP